MVQTAQVLDLLNAIEDDVAVDEWRAGDMRIWPLVRFDVWSRLNDYRPVHPNGAPQAAPSRLAFYGGRARELVTGVVAKRAAETKDARHVAAGGPADVVLLGDNVSRVRVDGAWYDRLCGPVIEAAESNNLSWLHLEPHHLYRHPRASASRWIQPHIDARWFGARLAPSKTPVVLPGIARAIEMVQARGARGAIDQASIVRNVRFVESLVSMFEATLRHSAARVAFVVDYGPIQMAFAQAGRNADVPVVELQHGAQGALHWSYSRWNNVPDEGYGLLPSDYWTWSADEARVIAEWTQRTTAHRVTVAGNPWLDRWTVGHDAVVQRYREQVRMALGQHDSRTVLVTLQPTLCTEPQLRPLLGTLTSAELQQVRWVFRLHPAMKQEESEQAMTLLGLGANDRRLTEQLSELPLPAVLAVVDCHVTHSSSAVIEAAAFGITSVAFGAEAPLFFPTELETGTLELAASSDELAAKVALTARRSARVPAATRANYAELLRRTMNT